MAPTRIARTKKFFDGKKALAVVGIACVVFMALGVLVRYSFLQGYDLKVTQELQERNLPALQAIMVAATWSGSPAVVPFLGALAAFGLWRAGLPRGALLVLLSLLAIPVDVALKEFWDRARPDAEIVHVAVKTAGTSFPSGHAMGGTAFYGALAALAWIHVRDRRFRIPATLAAVGLPVLIDVSRVYLGAHWTSDVIGGSAVGLLVLIPLVRWYLDGVPDEEATQDAKAEQAKAATHTPLSSE